MLENLNKYNVILASKSPRRRSLLKMLDIDFETTSVDVDETFDEELSPERAAVYLAEKKTRAYMTNQDIEGKLLITADTLVCIKEKILGKPEGYDEAIRTLRALSGHWHTVVTGVCLKTLHAERSFYSSTDVHFKKLAEEEIHYYIENYQPYDKAGAYGIQEWIGYIGIDRIRGSFYNVMGLPVQRLYEELKVF